MIYYIVYYDSKGYYAGWKSKIEDKYNESYHFANRYKSLIHILSKLCIDIINLIKKEYDKYQAKLKKDKDKLSKHLTDNDRLLNSETKTAT
jgi:hypothetical protein